MALGLLVNRVVRLIIFDAIIARTTGMPVPKLLSQITSLLIFIVTIAACANIVFNQDLTVLCSPSRLGSYTTACCVTPSTASAIDTAY